MKKKLKSLCNKLLEVSGTVLGFIWAIFVIACCVLLPIVVLILSIKVIVGVF